MAFLKRRKKEPEALTGRAVVGLYGKDSVESVHVEFSGESAAIHFLVPSYFDKILFNLTEMPAEQRILLDRVEEFVASAREKLDRYGGIFASAGEVPLAAERPRGKPFAKVTVEAMFFEEAGRAMASTEFAPLEATNDTVAELGLWTLWDWSVAAGGGEDTAVDFLLDVLERQCAYYRVNGMPDLASLGSAPFEAVTHRLAQDMGNTHIEVPHGDGPNESRDTGTGNRERPAALTVLHLSPSPRKVSSRNVGQGGMLTLLATGIVNPFGPTLNALMVDGDPELGRELPVLRLMLNPFVQEIEHVGEAKIGESWNLAGDLPPFFSSIAGSCPTILMPSAMLDEAAALALCAEFLQVFDDGFELREKVGRHPGDPFSRVQEDVEGLGDILSQFQAGAELDEAKRRLTPEEARHLAAILLDHENLKKELGAFFYAWKGSIDFQSGSLASEALSLEDFTGWFSMIVPSCRMPELEG